MLSVVQNWVYQRLSHEEQLQYIKIAIDAWTRTASETPSRATANRRESHNVKNLPSLASGHGEHRIYSKGMVPFHPLQPLGCGGYAKVDKV
jgi:hypothetical protein